MCLVALAVVAGAGVAVVSLQPSAAEEPLRPIRVQAPHQSDPSSADAPPTAATPAPRPRHGHAGPPDVPPPPPAIQTINPPAPAAGSPPPRDGDDDDDDDWDDDDWDDDD